MSKAIAYIAFDLGCVMVEWNPDYLFSQLINDDSRLTYLRNHIVTMDWIEEVDRGKPLSQAVAERIAAYPDFTKELTEYGGRWIETLPRLINGTVALKQRLADKGYPLYALSNFGRDTYAQALGVYPELGEFDGAVISGHEGFIKPEAKIYKILLDRYKLNPESLLFIDDRADNVAMALELGIQAVQFTTPAALEADLLRMGVL